MSSEKETIILAYSGGLDTSCILVWLIEKGYRVIPCMVDVGQTEDFEAARQKALKLGAEKIYIEDRKEEFVSEFIWPGVQAGLKYEGRYLLGTALARPCIARCLIEVAKKENAKYISHGATGKGNDQVRFELSCYALHEGVKFLAPWREEDFLKKFIGRKELLEYAELKNIPVKATKDKSYSEDDNLMHVSYESGILEDPGVVAPTDMYQLTKDVEKTPDVPGKIALQFNNGVPTKLTDDITGATLATDPVSIMSELNKVAGLHGVGRIDIVENRFIGMKSRGCYETPAGTVIWAAHEDLELITMDKEVRNIKEGLSLQLGKQIYNGMWFSPEGAYLRNCISSSQGNVNGTVHMKLFKGNVMILSRESPNSLYNEELVSMDLAGDYEPADVSGFIRITALRLREQLRAKSFLQ
jgi:argininosuccinate synthase